MIKNLKRFIKLFHPRYQKLILEYQVEMKPRYGYGLKPHDLLYEIVNNNRELYSALIEEMVANNQIFQKIKHFDNEKDENQPSWNNGYFPGLDIVALYSIIKKFKPNKIVEIGSGNSTKVAKKAIIDNFLQTKITSIDPFPRASIDHLADEVIRKPLESFDDFSFITNSLESDDILFIDNSHRCLPNSDATVTFLELLPKLRKGVLLHVHDIYLPYDYPQFMCDRFYSEQYVLAAFLIANPSRYKPLFPCIFVSEDPKLSKYLDPIWQSENTKNVERHGGSFWMQIN